MQPIDEFRADRGDILLPVLAQTDMDATRIFGALNNIEAVAAALIDRLPSMTDDVLMMARGYAKQLGSAALRVECAADAEIVKRTHAPVGRGHKDIAGTGVEATLAHIARDAHTSKSAIRTNAQIYNAILGDDDLAAELVHLQEKEFYVQACRALDPRDAIRQLARRKMNDPGYTTRQAKSDIDGMLGMSAKASRTQTETDWRGEVANHCSQILNLLPEGFSHPCRLAIEHTAKVVWKCNPDGTPAVLDAQEARR